MLPAIPNPLVMWWFDGYCRSALRGFFHRVHLYGSAAAGGGVEFDANVPRLYVANHSSFWDGIVLYHWIRAHRRQPVYCMIDAVQVAEHPFFRRVGGFSVDRTDPRDGMASLAYAAGLLGREPRPAVVVFPQGKIEPNDVRPIRVESGIARLAERVPGLRVVPLALRYEFWVEQRAEAMLWCGPEMDLAGRDRGAILADVGGAIQGGLDHLARAGRTFRPGDQILLTGRASISHWKRRLPWRRG